jgi:hypothetical protein
MTRKASKLPVWLITNAWREILTRIFDGLEVNFNVSPEWLVNPATNRRLKLDMLYPQIGLAVRLEGLQGKQRRQRPTLAEEEQKRIRDEARLRVCRAHGIELIIVDVNDDNPKHTFRNIDLSLSRVAERVTDDELVSKISQARATAASLARRITDLHDLKLYAELWEDRQYQIPEPTPAPVPSKNGPSFTVGMEVEHTTFGLGVITAVTPSGDDLLLTVDFVAAGQKTLMASLVGEKLLPK